MFSEVDQSAWGYKVWHNGDIVDRFWNDFDVVSRDASLLEHQPRRAWQGSPSTLARLVVVPEATLAPYYARTSKGGPVRGKAHPDDEHDLTNHWVRTDFMRRLGIDYSLDGGKRFHIDAPGY